MLKKSITFELLDGTEVTEDFYFSFAKSELAKMELTTNGGLAAELQRLIAADNAGDIIGMFEKIILDSHGERSPDGRKFIKSSDISTAFSQTDAYDKLFMELMTDTEAALEFVRGILPKGMSVDEKLLAIPEPQASVE